MDPYSVVYFGSPKIAIPPLSALLENGPLKVNSVVTQLPKKMGRKQVLSPTPIEEFAGLNKLIIQYMRSKAEHEYIKKQTDFFIVCAYGKILPKSLLEIPKFGAINIHFSLLPKYRGASPIQEALLHGDTVTGVTFILMNEGLDEGDILLQESIEIKNEDNAQTLSEKLSVLSAKLLSSLLLQLAEGKILARPQDHKKASYCRKIKKEDAEIHPQKETTMKIYNKIRAYTPWPGTFMKIGEKRVKILRVTPEPIVGGENIKKITPGGWLIENKKLYLGTKNGVLEIQQIQPEGKKPMSASEFIRGYGSHLE